MPVLSIASDTWEIFHYINSNSLNDSDYEVVDSLLSSKLDSINCVIIHHSNFVDLAGAQKKLPKTKKVLNDLLATNGNQVFPDWFVSSLSVWLNQQAVSTLLSEWLDDDVHKNVNISWLLEHAKEDNKLYIKIFDKLVRSCKKNKSDKKIEEVKTLFCALDKKYLKEACDILSKATPSVGVCLLSRCSDIDDNYVIAGLKALSKLSRQKSINFKIDFNLLGKLGPKARLDVMKQLLGLCNKWKHNKQLPFTQTPSRDSLKNFLFPATFKYNNEVIDILDKFEEFLNPKLDLKPKYSRY